MNYCDCDGGEATSKRGTFNPLGSVGSVAGDEPVFGTGFDSVGSVGVGTQFSISSANAS